jgi:hypothetical protein
MKFTLALLAYIGLGLGFAAGILKAVHGNPWILLAVVAGYLGLFVSYGCRSHS